MKMVSFAIPTVLALAFTAGCAPDPTDVDNAEESTGKAVSALEVENGILLNGTQVNGTQVNGTQVNGTQVNGTQVNGTQVNGTTLSGTTETGVVISGTGFIGADMVAHLGNSTTVTVHIDNISSGDIPGMLTYDISVGGVNVCANGQKAVLAAGVWNYATGEFIDDSTQFTIACRGAAIAKCEEWGYPRGGNWSESNGTDSHNVSKKYFHDACTRMVRGDYCGDGVPHTVSGTTIDVWDAAGWQTQTANSGLDFEAQWSPSGATCVKHSRWYTTTQGGDTYNYIQTHCPAVWAPTDSSCDGGASLGSKFFTSNLTTTGTNNDFSAGADLDHRPLLRNASTQH